MSVAEHNVIDFVAHDPDRDIVILVMVEDRQWGDSGQLLVDLQEKFNTYYAYSIRGQLVADYPPMAGKPVQIELRTSYPPGERELEYLRIVTSKHLEPEGICFTWRVIGETTPSTNDEQMNP